MSKDRIVGRVTGLWRYPVKSMGSEALTEADVSWHGLAGDRRWAFVRDKAVHNGFPWLTLRENRDMSRYAPAFTNPSRPDTSPTVVTTLSGAELNVSDPALAAEICPEGARVIRQARGVFDTFPISLISTQTIEALGAIVSHDLDVQRFRPNILVDAVDGVAFPEDEWLGRVIRIGAARVRVDKRDGRCVVITIDPETGERSPAVLKAVADHRQGCLGVYGTTVEAGAVGLGDEVVLESER